MIALYELALLAARSFVSHAHPYEVLHSRIPPPRLSSSSTAPAYGKEGDVFRISSRELNKLVLYVAPSPDGNIVFDGHNGKFLNVNTTGLEIWKRLSAKESPPCIADALSISYGISADEALNDVLSFATIIEERGLSAHSLLIAEAPASSEKLEKSPAFSANLSGAPRATRENAALTRRAFLWLSFVDCMVTFRSFESLCSYVHEFPVKKPSREILSIVPAVLQAIDQACIWYPKKAVCLQRSVVTTLLLRSNGVSASLCIGVHALPFSAHAWVEAKGVVVNDAPAVRRFFHTVNSY